jgi:hypothetical protein
MTKARYSTEVLIQNGRIRRSTPVGLETASDEQRTAIELMKPVMNTWLRSKISDQQSAEVLVKAKYLETANGLTVEFKIQQVVPIG